MKPTTLYNLLLAVSTTALLDPSDSACCDVPSSLSKIAGVDGVEPLDLAVPQPPTRPGRGKGKSQREFAKSLAASSAVAERPEEAVGLLGGEAVFDDEFLGIIEELRVDVYELWGLSKSARRRQTAALRLALERLEGLAVAFPLPPAAAAAFAEIQLALM